MAGFVAIVADGTAPVEGPDLSALVRTYQELRGTGAVRTVTAGDWARVAGIDGATPVVHETDGASWSLTVGCAYAPVGLPSALPQDLDGQFATIRYLSGSGQLQVITDPFGMQDVYVAHHRGRTYVSTSALVLARHLGAEPNLLGLKLFLRAGVQFGPVTHWNAVERVEPATVVTYAHGKPRRREGYWHPEVDEQVRSLSLGETIARCADAGVAVLERRLRSDGLVSADITGGFDSRLVTVLLDKAGASFETVTVAEDPVDAPLARAVAETAGWRFRAQALPADWRIASSALERAVAWGDGRLDALTLAEVLWRQQDRSTTTRQVVTGGGGENFGPSPWLQELWRAGRTRTVNYDNLMNMRVFLPLDVSVVREDPRREAEPYVREVLSRRAAGYGDELNTTQLDVIHAYREVGHFGAYRSANEAEVRGQLPCYFRDFWSVAFSANHRWRNGHRLHRGVIERLDSRVADVETQRGGPAALMTARNAHRFLPYHARLARTALRKLRRRGASGASASHRTAGARSDAVRGLRRDGVLQARTMRSGPLYDGVELERLLLAAERGDLRNPTMVGRVVTVELLLRASGSSL